jgi:hypothetical protein
VLPRRARADAPGLPPSGALTFDVHGKGMMLGRHHVTFSRAGTSLTVETHIDMALKLGPVSFFSYTHHAVEGWKDGRFDRLETNSVLNGRKQSVRAHSIDNGVMIEASDSAPYLADADVLPLTHWNRQIMDGPLFNPQDGKILRVRLSGKGADPVQLADGRNLPATRYSLTGETQIDDWYDRDGVWAALRGKVKDGSVLTYRRTEG